MLTIYDFNKPEKHPHGMLAGYTHAYEKERNLAVILRKCIEAGDLNAAIATQHDHPTMVSDGLLTRVAERMYRLTTKAKGLLYSVYGKEKHDEPTI
jgi:hypothetical protein